MTLCSSLFEIKYFSKNVPTFGGTASESLSCWGLIHDCVGELLKLGHHREYQLHKSGGWQLTCFIVVSSNRLSISWQVLQIEAALRAPDVGREDLAHILQAVQVQEKQNLRMVGQPRNHTLGLNVYIEILN